MAALPALPTDLAFDDPTRLRRQLNDWLVPAPSRAHVAHSSLALVLMGCTIALAVVGLRARRRHISLRLMSCQNGAGRLL